MVRGSRLELTWVNKDKRLHTDAAGHYEWVDQNDPRIREVRAIEAVATVGAPDPERPNLLIEGDALHALTALNRVPALAERYAGQVRLVYVDPPFNTGQAFADYDDNLDHSIWLSMFRDRLQQLNKLLSSNGSIWVHLDDAEVHRCRCVMDEVLGSSNFVASIAWQKRTTRDSRPAFSSMHDQLLVYARGGPSRFRDRRNRLARTRGTYANPDRDPRGPWTSVPFTAQGFRKNQMYDIATPAGTVVQPPPGRCWGRIEPAYQELLAAGRIYFPNEGRGRPRVKRYVDEDSGLVPETVWLAAEVGTNDDAKRHVMAMFPDIDPFATPKPETLLERIIHISTAPGELVLDCFAGSGTTAAVAQKMGRQWVTIERSAETVARFTRPRLERVVAGGEPGGITDAQRWTGGGGFEVATVADSIVDVDLDTGDVYLADTARGHRFVAACAAQLGYAIEPHGPFIGRMGRRRLAVLEGLVGPSEIEFLLDHLDPDERVDVVARAVGDGVIEHLRARSRGSAVHRAPDDLVGSRVP